MEENRFLRACRLQPVDRTPVWFMRQAGRYMPEYRKIRENYSLLEICRRPEVAAEVTLQPIRRFPLDAAIIFADILLPLLTLGVGFEFAAGEGPVVHSPIRDMAQVRDLRTGQTEQDLGFVFEALALTRQRLDRSIALIGFAGAPFTLASYMIEGGHSRHFLNTKLLMYREPETWHLLMEKVSEVTLQYLRRQVGSGAQAIQLFDSWVGILGPDDYASQVLPYVQRIFAALDSGTPTIYFGTGTSSLLELMSASGAGIIGVDWRIPLGEAWRRCGFDKGIQGNLDPVALLGPRQALEKKIDSILEEAGKRPGHIFNLGHGILPGTPMENVELTVKRVHEGSQRIWGESAHAG
jgi:uroporphyrinogen decarboxylase